jgi:hypothetical protein
MSRCQARTSQKHGDTHTRIPNTITLRPHRQLTAVHLFRLTATAPLRQGRLGFKPWSVLKPF